MITDTPKITILLIRGLQNLVEEDETDSLWCEGNELFWPFGVRDVVGIHGHKIGDGDGVWFALKTGACSTALVKKPRATPPYKGARQIHGRVASEEQSCEATRPPICLAPKTRDNSPPR
jgi:hypothetical protein